MIRWTAEEARAMSAKAAQELLKTEWQQDLAQTYVSVNEAIEAATKRAKRRTSFRLDINANDKEKWQAIGDEVVQALQAKGYESTRSVFIASQKAPSLRPAFRIWIDWSKPQLEKKQ